MLCFSFSFLSLTWVHRMGLCDDNCTQFEFPLKCCASHVFDKIKHIRKTVPLVEAPCKSNIPGLLIAEWISLLWRCYSPNLFLLFQTISTLWSLWCVALFKIIITELLQVNKDKTSDVNDISQLKNKSPVMSSSIEMIWPHVGLSFILYSFMFFVFLHV